MNPEDDDRKICYWIPTIMFKKVWEIQGDNLKNYLNSQNIDARVFLVSSHTPIKGEKALKKKNA